MQLNNNGIYTYCNRGNARGKMKDYEEAITDYTLAIALKPNDSDTYFVRGDTKQNLGQTDNACLDQRKAEELGNKEASERIKKYCK